MTEEPRVTGPCMVRRERWLDLPDQETYPGFQVLLWTNHPAKLWAEFTTAESEGEMRAVLNQIVQAHNGWRDAKQQPLPEIGAPDFWDAIPQELAAQIVTVVGRMYMLLPNWTAGQRDSSGSG